MAKRVPKYIIQKMEMANKLMEQVVDLNFQVEGWMESNGIYDAFDFTYDYRDNRGYGYLWVDRFVESIENEIN